MAGSRLELLEQRSEELENKRGELTGKLVELASLEEELALEQVKQAPTKSPFALGTKPQQTRERRAKTEKELAGVEANLKAVTRALAEERAAAADARLAEVIREVKPYTEAELEGWREAGQLLAELHSVYQNKIVANVEARDDFDSECRSNGVLGGADADLQAKYEQAVKCPIQPFPIDFAGFLEKVMQVAFDPNGEGYRIVSGEAAMSAKRSDWSRLLPGLIPDLREQARHARLSGRVEKYALTAQAAEGRQPVLSAARRDAAHEAAAAVLETVA